MTVSFDRVATIYDATRWAGVPAEIMRKTLEAMVSTLESCKTVLDVGIGTGRWAEYLQTLGFSVVGIDVSLPMMAQARSKGVKDIVRADVRQLPFRDSSFDASVMIHVLHLMDNWVKAVHEVGRVTRKILISEAGRAEGFSPREAYLEQRTKLGYPLNRLNDAEYGLRSHIRPKIIVATGDYWAEFDADEEIDSFESRKSSVMWDMPDEIHRKIMQTLHSDYGGKRLRRHEFTEVVGWDPADLRGYLS